MTVKLLTELHLEFLTLKGCYTGSSESTHVKIPQCWKSHVAALNVVRTPLRNFLDPGMCKHIWCHMAYYPGLPLFLIRIYHECEGRIEKSVLASEGLPSDDKR